MNKDPIATRGVVVGAGIAGLLAARVLADHCEEVTLLDRDQLPLDERARRVSTGPSSFFPGTGKPSNPARSGQRRGAQCQERNADQYCGIDFPKRK